MSDAARVGSGEAIDEVAAGADFGLVARSDAEMPITSKRCHDEPFRRRRHYLERRCEKDVE